MADLMNFETPTQKIKRASDIQQQSVEQRQEELNKYYVPLDGFESEVIKSFVDMATTPEEREDYSYRAASAIKYSQWLDIPLEEAFTNLDYYNSQFIGGSDTKTAKSNFIAITDNVDIGVLQGKRNDIGKKLMEAENNGYGTVKELRAELAEVDAKINALSDEQVRSLPIEAVKDAALSLPFTVRGIAAQTAGTLLLGPLGGIAVGTLSSWEAMAGEEYLDLIEDGHSPELSRNVALVSSLFQGMVESMEGLQPAYAATFGTAEKAATTGVKAMMNNITKNFFKNVYTSGTLGKIAGTAGKAVGGYVWSAVGEGLEEVEQGAINAIAKSLATAIDEYAETNSLKDATGAAWDKMKSQELATKAMEDFKGGFLGALILGAPNIYFDAKATISDFQEVAQKAETIDSKEAFIKETKDSPILEGMTEEAKVKAQEDIYNKYEPKRKAREEEKRAIEKDRGEIIYTSDNTEEVVEDESGRITAEDAYRNEEGRLNYANTIIDENEDGSTENQFLVKGKGNQEYGRILYNEDADGNVTINAFEMSAMRENLRQEVYTDFAEQHAGKNIEWNTTGKAAAELREELINNNVSGKKNGLKYFQDVNEVQNQRTRIKWDKQIRESIPSMNAEQRSTGIALVESFANKHGESIADYDMKVFNGKLFINEASIEAYQSALEQGMDPGKIGGYVDIDELGKSTKGIIYASEKGDATTWVHENAHIFRQLMNEEELAEAEKLFGVKDGNWTRQNEEDFAYALQGYAFEGKAVGEAKPLFDKLAQALVRVYNALKGKIDFNPELSEFIEGFFADPSTALAQAKRAVEQNERAGYKTEAKETVNENEEVINNTAADTNERVEAAADKATEDVTENLFYQIIGEKGAKSMDDIEENTIRMDNLKVAIEMTEAGKDDKTIRLATGWERGADGKWRYEIDDSEYKAEKDFLPVQYIIENNPEYKELSDRLKKNIEEYKNFTEEEKRTYDYYTDLENRYIRNHIDFDNLGNATWNYPVDLEDVLYAPELYKAYPELRSTRFILSDLGENTEGFYDYRKNILVLEKNHPSRNTLIHEIQHAIQRIENFAKGGTPEYVKTTLVKDFNRRMSENEIDHDVCLKLLDYKDLLQYELLSRKLSDKPEHFVKTGYWFEYGSFFGLPKNKKDRSEYLAEVIDRWRTDKEKQFSESQMYSARDKSDDELKKELSKTDRNIKKLFHKYSEYENETKALNELLEKSPYDLYKRLSGEVESRNAEARITLTPEERLYTTLRETEDVERDKQIVYFQYIDVAGAMNLDERTKRMYNKAEEMRENGETLENIRLQTGYSIGPDGVFQYEITDDDNTIISSKSLVDAFQAVNNIEKVLVRPSTMPQMLESLHWVITTKLDELNKERNAINKIYSAGELYTAKPELKDFPVYWYYDNRSIRAVQFEAGLALNLKYIRSPGELRSSLIYNIQNIIDTKPNVKGYNGNVYYDLCNALNEVERNTKKYFADLSYEDEYVRYYLTDPYTRNAAQAQRRRNLTDKLRDSYNPDRWVKRSFLFQSQEEVDNKIQSIVDKNEYYYYGIRADKTDLYNVGDEANVSHQLYQDADYDEDGNLIYPKGEGPYIGYYDAGELEGTSAIILKNEEYPEGYSIDEVTKAVKGYNNGDERTLYIIASDYMNSGNDPGEGIFQEAKVLAKIKENKDGTFEYEDNNGNFNSDNPSILFQEITEADNSVEEKTGRDNFFTNTEANFTITKAPNTKPDYTSNSGSEYWYTDEGVYRRSTHWGRVASCNWYLDGDSYQTTSYGTNSSGEEIAEPSVPNDIKEYVGVSEIKILDNSIYTHNITGFCKWDDFNKNVTSDMPRNRRLFQTVYHGSAADFDKFDTENYGLSGEGSMSFGYGTYLTGSEEIAREYAKRQRRVKFGSVEDIEEDIKFYEERKSEEEEKLKNFPSFEDYMVSKKQKIEKLESINKEKGHTESIDLILKGLKESGIDTYNEEKDYIKAAIERRNSEINALQEKLKNAKLNEGEKNKLYTVEIPDNGFIRWDGKQRQSTVNKIHKALFEKLAYKPNEYGEYPYKGVERELKDELNSSFNSEFTGETIYSTVSSYLGSDKRASKFLYDLGYSGIDYPAGTNFGTPDGKEARNYVIFNDEDAKIVNKQLFQYMDDILDEATLNEANQFDTWEEWYEFAKVMDTDGIITGEWDNVSEQNWFKSAWESAKKIYSPEQQIDLEEELKKDRDFVELIKKPGYLEDFLNRAKYYINSELGQPTDEEEAKEFESIQERKRFAANVMSDPVHFVDEPDETQSKKLLSMIEAAPREYRKIYAELFNDANFSVPEGYEYTADLSAVPEDLVYEVENMTPSQRKKYIETIQDEGIKQQLKSGTMPMDSTLDNYIRVAEKEIKRLEKEVKRLDEELKEDTDNISNAQKKYAIEEYDRLSKMVDTINAIGLKGNSRISTAMSAGSMATSNVVDASENGQYNTIMQRMSDIEKMVAGERDAAAIIAKAKERAYQKNLQAKRNAEREALYALRKQKKAMIKRLMRKVSFENTDYEDAKKIIAVQNFVDHWVRTGVNLWLGEEEVTAEEVWQQYRLDTDFREEVLKTLNEEIIKKRPEARRARQNLVEAMSDEGKSFEQWTPAMKNDLIIALGLKDQVIRLNLDKLKEQRKQAMHSLLDEKGSITEENMKIVYDVLPKETIARIRYTPMKKWTVDQVEELVKTIDDIHTEGKKVYAGRQALRRDRYEEIRKRIQDTVKDTGIKFNKNDTPEERKKKQEQIDKILGLRTEMKGTAAANSERQTLREKFMAADRGTGNVRRFSRVMDNWAEGVFTDTLCLREYMAYDDEQKAIRERTRHIQNYMVENGITMERLAEEVKYPGLIDGEDRTLTIDELLYIYIADKEETSKEAVMYGNFMTSEEKESVKQHEAKYDDGDARKWFKMTAEARYNVVLFDANRLVESDKALKGLVQVIENDYEKQYERLNRTSIEVFNMPVNRVTQYVPLYRLEHTGDTNEQQVAKDILADTTGAPSSYVGRGMTKNRVEISPVNQKPVQLGLVQTWASSMEKTEHFISYGELVRDLNAIYTSQAAAATREAISSRYGSNANDYIKEYINELANPNKGTVKDELGRWIHALRGSTAPAYLAWKSSGIIKQLCTSPWPFMAYISPVEYISAATEFVAHYNTMTNFVKEKSVFMDNRTIDPIIDLIKEAQRDKDNKYRAALANFNKIGMQGLEIADWVSVAPGWYAAYKKKTAELENANKKLEPMADGFKSSEEIDREAVAYADDIVRLTQPSNRKADLAPLFKNSSETAKMVLQFQTSLNVIYQNLRYDIPYQVRNGQWKNAVGAIIGYAAAGILMNAVVSGGLFTGDGSDDEPDEKLKRLVWYATTQFTDSVPVMGSVITNTAQKMLTGEKPYGSSSMFPVLDRLSSVLTDVSDDKYGKAAEDFAQGVAYYLGLPVSGTKEALRVFGIGDNDGELDFKPEALWGRR